MEIAAVGVSIAIFNQASKVTIFPLVSITTSFVAEEDTVQRVSKEPHKVENLEKKDSAKTSVVKEDVMLENLEKGSVTDTEKNKDSIPEDGIFSLFQAHSLHEGKKNDSV